ncbi:MAG: MBL fold metallo-hydrolase [bacterium]|nr:MBL fold metallo-hydrolase [bacterium]MDZ4231535.1 MBL fold metallo-hydrolase [Patescibacteria group bacterium]
MVISLLGSSGVKCQVADFSLVVEPTAKKRGNIMLSTTTDFFLDPLSSEDNLISGPGEYEVEGVRIKGINLPHEANKDNGKAAYSVRFDDIRLGFLPSLSHNLEDTELDMLGEIDILLFDVERSTLDGKEIASLIKKIEPRMVVAVSDKGAKKLLEELGQKAKSEDKLTLKAKDLDKEESGIQVVWLKE